MESFFICIFADIIVLFFFNQLQRYEQFQTWATVCLKSYQQSVAHVVNTALAEFRLIKLIQKKLKNQLWKEK